MTFTKTPPTLPGDYRWRKDANDTYPLLIEIYTSGDHLFAWREGVGNVESKWRAWGGSWHRLVPDEEVEKAWREGFKAGLCNHQERWVTSRARRVMEGKE